MGVGSVQSFYVQSWMTRATYGIAAFQLVAAVVLAVLADPIGVGPVFPAMFAFGAVLTGYQAYWTERTPIAVIDSKGVTLRPALLAGAKAIEFADVRAFARIPPGWLVFLSRNGDETRMPLTALSEKDADALVEALMQYLTEVSYIEP